MTHNLIIAARIAFMASIIQFGVRTYFKGRELLANNVGARWKVVKGLLKYHGGEVLVYTVSSLAISWLHVGVPFKRVSLGCGGHSLDQYMQKLGVDKHVRLNDCFE